MTIGFELPVSMPPDGTYAATVAASSAGAAESDVIVSGSAVRIRTLPGTRADGLVRVTFHARM